MYVSAATVQSGRYSNCQLTYLLTPWCRVFLEKLTGLQLVKKFHAFHGTPRFFTALTSVRHLSLSCASPIQSIYPHPMSWRSILILSTHLRLGLPSSLSFLRLLTYLLTPWCRALLEKLTGLQLVKKFPAFHGTLRFITTITSVRHLSLSWASPIQSIYPHPMSWRSILILSTHLRLGLPSSISSLRLLTYLLHGAESFLRS